jgi:hypothetical protein
MPVVGERPHHVGGVVDRRSHAHMIGSAVEVTQEDTRKFRDRRAKSRYQRIARGSKAMRVLEAAGRGSPRLHRLTSFPSRVLTP